MGSGDDKTSGRSGPFEVVADRSQDGTFEIRLSRGEDAAEESSVVDPSPEESTAWTTDVAHRAAPQPIRRTQILAIAGLATAILATLFFVVRTPGPSARPKTVEVAHASSFRGFVIATQAPTNARAVRVSFPEDAIPQAAPAYESDEFDSPAMNDPFGGGSVQVRGDIVPNAAPGQQQMGYAEYNRLHRDEALQNLRTIIEGEIARRSDEDSNEEPAQATEEAVEEELVEDELDEGYGDYEE